MEIKILARQGLSIREISRQMHLSRNTVRRYLRAASVAQRKRATRRAHKLDGYRAYLRQRMQAAYPAWLPATVLLREITERGYDGGVSRLRDFMRTLRAVRPVDPVVRFETLPGQQMQCDWIVFRRGKHPLSAFVATLGWSRASYVEFVIDEKLTTLLDCHQHAFAFFGGVTQEALYDNMKTIVLTRDAYGPGVHRFQSGFWDFAKHFGFVPRLCRPYRAKTKGKVERFNGYLRRSFYNPLASQLAQERLLLDLDTANAAVHTWLREVANARVHGTTQHVPAVRLLEERVALHTLPPAYRGLRIAPVSTPPPGWHRFSHQPMQHALSLYDHLFAEAY